MKDLTFGVTVHELDRMEFQCDSHPSFYHGSNTPLSEVKMNRTDDDGFALYLSASVNVARRYGPHVSRFTLLPTTVMSMSIRQWCFPSVDESNSSVVLVRGSEGCYDFPANMLAVRNTHLLRFEGVLTAAELEILDDGLSFLHEPTGPASRGWDVWVADHHSGNLQEALTTLDWVVEQDGSYRFRLPETPDAPFWTVSVCPESRETWRVLSSSGENASGNQKDMLILADQAVRVARRARGAARIEEVDNIS